MNGRPLIDLTSLFSAPEVAPRRAAPASLPPTTAPFQAPDFEEDESLLFEDEHASFSDMEAAQRKPVPQASAQTR
ncbi:hypothetical protein ABT381_21465 [Streptomyces sp. NPDC000151]|uniref:hypothetical protein n=1 Tax=Streptomyces sp. NPDC000151 TaxID=3154244 RepID=UPI003319E295